jgi:MFS transporter, UMF1 family
LLFLPLLSTNTMPATAVPRYRALLDTDPEDADDERSFSDIEDDDYRSTYPPHGNIQTPTPQFVGQDVRPTSRKELMGWYSYAWAAEVFVVCGVGSFIPMTLEQLARENGVLLSDRTTPCGPSSSPGTGLGPGAGGVEDDGPAQCVITLLGLEMNTASFAMCAA